MLAMDRFSLWAGLSVLVDARWSLGLSGVGSFVRSFGRSVGMGWARVWVWL